MGRGGYLLLRGRGQPVTLVLAGPMKGVDSRPLHTRGGLLEPLEVITFPAVCLAGRGLNRSARSHWVLVDPGQRLCMTPALTLVGVPQFACRHPGPQRLGYDIGGHCTIRWEATGLSLSPASSACPWVPPQMGSQQEA